MNELILSDHDAVRLRHCERVIETGVGAYYDMGMALREIQAQRLYRCSHSSFDQYLKHRWGLRAGTAYRCISAALVTRQLIEAGGDPPDRESQARPLTSVDTDTAVEAWAMAQEAAGDRKPTALQVTQAVAQVEAKKRGGGGDKAAAAAPGWGTPLVIVEATRELFGGVIDLDVASDHEWNDRIGAKQWFCEDDDALNAEWAGRVLCNPPHGYDKNRELLAGAWLARALDAVESGAAEAVMVWCPAHIGASWIAPIWGQLVCIIDERMPHVNADGSSCGIPKHGNLAALIVNRPRDWFGEFARLFRGYGPIAACVSDYKRMRGN